MGSIFKHMTRPTGKINIATTFTKKAIYILIVQAIKIKRTTMTKIPSPSKKADPVLKTYPRI